MSKSLADEVLRLKMKQGALVLAHNYVPGDVQDIADFVGDSLELSIKAKAARAPLVIFCGVGFMAETAKILSPASRVIHPDPAAGCPMADMVRPGALAAYRAEHPDTLLVAYVNTTAETKAEVDICCTSSNARLVIESLPKNRPILFLPDRNLGANVRAESGRALELWPGFCPTHERILPEMIIRARQEYPDAVVLAHPECRPAVVQQADYALSTGGMLRHVHASKRKTFIIGTEDGLLHRLRKENPEKTFISPYPPPRCPNMKKITMETVYWALSGGGHEVTIAPELMDRARAPIERMLALT